MQARIDDVLAGARERLARAPSQPARREALLLLARTLGESEAWVLAHPERALSEEERGRFEGLLERRLRGEPAAYLFGEREFWGRDFVVDPRVLIPRPDTEHLVEAALELAPRAARTVDLGTGSGCIAITLSLERPDLRLLGVDLSLGALSVARRNATRHRAGVAWLQADLLAALDCERIDLLVANLPYVATAQRAELQPDVVEHEPATALFAGSDGLAAFRRLFPQLKRLRAGTPVVLEVGADQGAAIERLARQYHVRVDALRRDYAGHTRVAILQS